jgi:hypothetical protein
VGTDCTGDFSWEKAIEKTILRVLGSSEFSHSLDPERTLHYLASLGLRLFDLTNLRRQAPVRTNGLCAITFSLPPLRSNIKLFTMGKWARNHDALACCRKAASYRMSRFFNRQRLRQR